MNFKPLALFLSVFLISVLVQGCSTQSRGTKSERKDKESSSTNKEQKIDEIKVKDFVKGGYDSGIDYAVTSAKLTLNLDQLPIDVSIVQPKRSGKYPLVIYLPGMGETSEGAVKFRNAWATSGFVVVSTQLLKDDEFILTTPAAKEGDFSFIRHDRFSPEVVISRLKLLSKFVDYLKQAVHEGDERFVDIDLDHIAIVGFDIGATSPPSSYL